MSRNVVGPWVWVILLASACAAGTPVVSDAVIPFRTVDQFLIVVQLRIGTAGPYDFMVDTGADTSIIDPKLADELKLSAVEHVVLHTPTSSARVLRSELPLVKLGYIAVKRLEVVVEPLQEIHNVDRHIRGVLGENFFEFFDYMLDYRNQQFVIDIDHTRPDLLGGDRLPLSEECGSQADAVEVAVQGTASVIPEQLRMKLDSGIRVATFLAPHEARAKAEAVGLAFKATTDFGSSRASLVTSWKVRVGKSAFSMVPFLVLGANRKNDCYDGLLPTTMLRSVYVSHSGKFVMVQPIEY